MSASVDGARTQQPAKSMKRQIHHMQDYEVAQVWPCSDLLWEKEGGLACKHGCCVGIMLPLLPHFVLSLRSAAGCVLAQCCVEEAQPDLKRLRISCDSSDKQQRHVQQHTLSPVGGGQQHCQHIQHEQHEQQQCMPQGEAQRQHDQQHSYAHVNAMLKLLHQQRMQRLQQQQCNNIARGALMQHHASG